MAKVSICIPAYKQVELLKKNLQSIAEQNFLDHETVITDDSPDAEVEMMVNEFKSKISNLHYFRNKIPLGSPENWNESIRRSSGELIKIMHHDDWFTDKTSLGKFVKMMDENPSADFSFCASNVEELNTGLKRVARPSAENIETLKKDPEIVYFWNFIGAPSATIFRRSAFVPFDKNIHYVVDSDFYIRMLKKTGFSYSDEALITNASKYAGQVTEASLDADTQIREFVYLFNKINNGTFPPKRYLSFLKSLFLKYGVRNFAWLRERKIPVPRPIFVFRLLFFYLSLTGKHKPVND
ncbi:MAG: glycosyltransferase family 2 protein [Bacteroidia bacterium]|nr:glycosyltransferase family 2 protein [Bacteroidia bacterium]